MAQLNVYKVTSLPSSPIADSIYLVKGTSDTEVSMFVTDSGGMARPIVGTPLLDSGSTSIGAVRYAGHTRTAGQFYGGDTEPSNNSINLNYEGTFMARRFRVPLGQSIFSRNSDSSTINSINFEGGSILYNIFNIPSGGGHIFNMNNENVAVINALKIETLGGIQTATPLGGGGFTNPIWRLGSVASSTPTPNRSIRIQIGSQIFDVPAQFIANV